MQPDDFKKQSDELSALLADIFRVTAVYQQNDNIIFSLEYRFDDKLKSQAAIKDRLNTAGYNYKLHQQGETLLLSINPARSHKIPPLNIILFVATLFTVYFVPVFYKKLAITATLSAAYDETLKALAAGAGLQFTVAMISILFVHEMGHFIAGRRRQIITSWPYFIPAPNEFGTFGAVIRAKSPFWNRRDLIEVGASGPIAGWILAVGWLVYGLYNSSTAPVESILYSGQSPFLLEGESILMRISTLNILGRLPEGHVYGLSEAAFAGWVGLLVTAINLIPINQLDGGHIIYGLFGKRQRIIGLISLAALLGLGFLSLMWWIYAAIGLIIGVNHPATMDDTKPLSRISICMALLSILILILSFTPMPVENPFFAK